MKTEVELPREEKCIKIAEACGYKEGKGRQSAIPECGWIRQWYRPEGVGLTPNLPRYFDDLNIMHEAVATLTPEQKEAFVYKLYDFTNDSLHDYDGDTNWLTIFEIASMTAAQRAEAFGLTLKLWD